MKRFLGAACLACFIASAGRAARADDKDATAILDRAIKALGGEEKLSKASTLSWKSKGTITIQGNDNAFTGMITMQGLDHSRVEFEGKFGENDVKGVTVLAGDKGWRKFGDMEHDMDAGEIANEKRTIYLQVIPITVYPVKGKGFKTELAGEEKVNEKPAAVVKVTGPDGKDFKLYFDKENGLPVRLVATVVGFQGEFTQDTTYREFKDFGGIKRATKIESKADGEKFVDVEVTEFKVLDKADPETFTQPK
jgi:hypothetical protein